MKFEIKRIKGTELSVPEGLLVFYTDLERTEEPVLNTTFEMSFPLGVFGNLYNFSYPSLSK